MARCSCHPLHIGNRPVDPGGPKNIDDACPMHGVGTAYFEQITAKHREATLPLRVRHALTMKLIKLRACCLDDEADFKRVVAAAADTTMELIALDRRSRT